MPVIVDMDPTIAHALQTAAGDETTTLPSLDALRQHLETDLIVDTVVLGPSTDLQSAMDLAETLRVQRPSCGVVLVRHRIDTSILTNSLRAGVREVVDARDLSGLNGAVRRSQKLAAELREQGPDPQHGGGSTRRGRVVTIFSAKGGCGKTTLATNLAASLADGGRREVCLIDLDLAFGDVAIALQLFPAHTIADAV